MCDDAWTDGEIVLIALAVQRRNDVRLGRCIIEGGFFENSGFGCLLVCNESMKSGDVRRRKVLALPGEVGVVRIKLSESPSLQMSNQCGLRRDGLVARCS